MSLLTLLSLHYTAYIRWCYSRPNHCVAGLLLSQQALVLLVGKSACGLQQTCLLCFNHPDTTPQELCHAAFSFFSTASSIHLIRCVWHVAATRLIVFRCMSCKSVCHRPAGCNQFECKPAFDCNTPYHVCYIHHKHNAYTVLQHVRRTVR